MPSLRETIINALATRIATGSLGFTNVIKTHRMPRIEQLDHRTFPLCHIVDIEERLDRFPNRLVTAELNPLIRCFYQSLTLEQCHTQIVAMKSVMANPSLAGANFCVLTGNTIKTFPEHIYVEIEYRTKIVYYFRDSEP